MSKEYISSVLKNLRTKSGLTAEEVGNLIGKSGKTVNGWENGRSQPDAELLLQLCDIYKVNNILDTFIENRQSIKPLVVKDTILTTHEKEVITAYRSKPEMQQAVDRLLGVEESKVVGQVFRAACNGKNPEYITLTDEQRKKLEEAPSTDEL